MVSSLQSSDVLFRDWLVMSGKNDARSQLEFGIISECVPMLSGSNNAFKVHIVDEEGQVVYGVYKPRRGEKPLWDFPEGSLYRRERAAYLLALAAGWEFIPLTVIRDGPYGVGSVQAMISFQSGQGYFGLDSSHANQLWPIAVFDLVVNNADRKGGHCLLDEHGKATGSAMARLVSKTVSIAVEAVLDGELPPGVSAAPSNPQIVDAWMTKLIASGERIVRT